MPIYALGDAVPDIHPQAYVHPDAVIIGAVVIGAESSVWPCAVLRGDGGQIVVGERTSIQDGTVVHTTPEYATVVGDDCVVGHIVHLEGCTIERASLVGSGAVVLHGVVVRTGAVVAANAVLLDGTEVPSGALAVGAPATIKPGKAKPEAITLGRDVYVAKGRAYREGLRRIDGPPPRWRVVDRRAASIRNGAVLGLVLTVPAGEAELAADALWALGVAAIEERGGTSGTEDGLLELWTSLGDDPETVAHAAEAFPARWRWRVVELDPSVIDAWRAHAHVSWIERDLVVVPAWLPFTAPADTIVVRIEPGATFGLGDHPTTVLSLRGLRAALPPAGTVLDVGCGSGVLAVTAAVLGAASATAIDISPGAPAVATANARANGVEERVHASNTPLTAVNGTFDVVVANLLAPALLTLAEGLVQAVAPGGALVISGILTAHHDHVVAALAPLQPVERRTKEGWTAITLRS